ncbi:hypothetical protein [Methylobacter sp. sgz302048]|uniref:hypothetical protein n=1 Tax=Methylobacter sp. sgz302048 TaxID=3455945 RepID=UPI003FA18F30
MTLSPGFKADPSCQRRYSLKLSPLGLIRAPLGRKSVGRQTGNQGHRLPMPRWRSIPTTCTTQSTAISVDALVSSRSISRDASQWHRPSFQFAAVGWIVAALFTGMDCLFCRLDLADKAS